MSRPDTDSSSMRGYERGSGEFNASASSEQAPAPTTAPKAAPTHDINSASMRGWTSTGPVR